MVPRGLRVVQRIKANVSAADSRIGLTLTEVGREPSPASASRGCRNNKVMAVTLTAIMTRDLIALVIFKSPVKCCSGFGSRVERWGELTRSAPRVLASHGHGLKPSTR